MSNDFWDEFVPEWRRQPLPKSKAQLKLECGERTGHGPWRWGRGFNANGVEQYVKVCVACEHRSYVDKAAHPYCANGPVFYDNRPGCCGGRGCHQCSGGVSCARCGGHRDLQRHHWAPSHLFGWEEANEWPTSWLCQPCHARWHRIVTPNMHRKTA